MGKKEKKQRSIAFKIVSRIVFSAVAAVILTFLSVIVPFKVTRPADLDNMLFGKPIAFIRQSYGGVINEYLFPIRVFLQKECFGDDTAFSIENFFISLAINFAVVLAVVFIIFIVKKRKKKNLK